MEDKFGCKVTHSSLNEQVLRGKSREKVCNEDVVF